MPTVVGVKLRLAPKTLWFDPAGSEPAEGDSVIVATERGTEIGLVCEAAHEVAGSALPAPLKPVVRVATPDDLKQAVGLSEREREALPVYRELVKKHKLDMKPIDVEYLFGGDKVVFYFAAEERVDFRDLVKELASHFKARIDMRQVGVRDEARMVGGIGHCGQPLCCVRFGGEFQPVSIRMAKEQDLPLNPLKISGLCGRLMCCLRYEFEAYKDFKGRAPKRGAIIETSMGLAKVTDLNTPHETVTLRFEDGTSVTIPLGGMECAKGTGCPCAVGAETLEAAGKVPTLVSASMDAETRTESGPARERKPRERGRERPAGEATKQQAQPQPRQRRERSPRQETAEAARAATQAPKTEGAPKDAGAAKAEGAPKSGRRRRRRRSGGGGKPEGS